MNFDALTIFGLIAVTLMLIFYALEHRSSWYVFLFAITCIMSSIYGFLQGAWPFGVIEIFWTIVALRHRHSIIWWVRRWGRARCWCGSHCKQLDPHVESNNETTTDRAAHCPLPVAHAF